MLTEPDILQALRVCYDPELQINIVDLGRIHAITVQPDSDAAGLEPRTHVRVDLLPRQDEQADAILAAQVTNRLYGLRAISRAEVQLLEAPAWTPDRMNAAARIERSQQQGLIQLDGKPGPLPE